MLFFLIKQIQKANVITKRKLLGVINFPKENCWVLNLGHQKYKVDEKSKRWFVMEKNAFFIALVGIEPFTLRLAIARFIAWLFDQLM